MRIINRMLKMLTLVAFLLLLVGCSRNSNNHPSDESGPSGNINDDYSIIINDVNRKIIYTARINLKSPEITKTTNEIKNMVNNDEWIEKEELTDKYNYLTIRIKTNRLENFLDNIKSDYETTSFNLESSDVTNTYANLETKILALENEQTRLLTLYESASIQEMIYINERLSKIETELLRLNQDLTNYDSLVEYSKVYLYIYGPKANPNPPSYGKTLKTTFKNGLNSVIFMFKMFLQGIVFLVPFLIVAIPVGGIIIGVNYYNKKKTKDKNNKDK